MWCLFNNFLDEMRVMKEKGTLWLNHIELDRMEFREIKMVLFEVFDALSIDKESIPWVPVFPWTIAGVDYEELKALSVSGHIVSPQFVYGVAGTALHRITFHFKFYGQYSAEDPQCAIFLEIEEIPPEVKRLRIEVDMKCNKRKPFRQLLRTRFSSKEPPEDRGKGFVTFHHRELDENSKMEWIFAVKMFNAQEIDEEEEYLRNLYRNFE